MTKNIQETFLNKLRKEKIPNTIIVTNGYQIQNAVIKSFDNFSILIESSEKQMLLFKHAISSIAPNENISLNEVEENE